MVKMHVFRAWMLATLLCFMFSINSCDDSDKGKGVIAVYQGSDLIENQSGVYDFGAFDIGETIPKITFTIKNEGDGKLLLTGTPKIEISGDNVASFTVDDSKTSSSLVPNVSTTFTIKFNPTNAGLKTAMIKISNSANAENPYVFSVSSEYLTMYDWTKTVNGENEKNIYFTTTDPQGNVYIAGRYKVSIDIGIDFGMSDEKKCESTASFVAKILADGSYAWTRQIRNNRTINSFLHFRGMTVDSSGDIYLVGDFVSTIDFGEDFGVSDTHTSKYRQDIYIMKIKSNGDYGWTKVIGNNFDDNGTAIVCDSDDNVYFSSVFTGTLDFGQPFGASDIVIATDNQNSAVTKFNANGDYLWTKQFKSTSGIRIQNLLIDNLNNLVIVGYFYGTINFGESFGYTDVKIGGKHSSSFLTKIKYNAEYDWTRIINGTSDTYIKSVAVDSQNNLYAAGIFTKSLNFGEDFGITNIKTAILPTYNPRYDHHDFFIMKINSDSSYGWVRQIGSNEDDIYISIVVDTNDSIFIIGSVYGAIDFGKDFGISDVILNTNKHNTVFITKINPDGSYNWTKCVNDDVSLLGFSIISIDNYNNWYIFGKYCETVDFGKPFGVSDVRTTETNYSSNIYIMKLQG